MTNRTAPADLPAPLLLATWTRGQITGPFLVYGYDADTVRRLLAEARREALEEAAVICDENIDPQEAAYEIRALIPKP